jgi:hypothetical protein
MRLVVQNKNYISFFCHRLWTIVLLKTEYYDILYGTGAENLYPTRQTSLFSTSGIFDLSEEIVSRNFCARETS